MSLDNKSPDFGERGFSRMGVGTPPVEEDSNRRNPGESRGPTGNLQ